MKTFAIVIVCWVVLFGTISAAAAAKTEPCSLKGKVRIVNAHADYKVYVNPNDPDVDVQLVTAFPHHPGQWQLVQAHEDFTVQIVTNRADADFEIKVVQRWPRCRQD